jgi:protein-disulfide isomerase
VELVAFADFQSAEYGRVAQTFQKLIDRFGGRLRIVVKNLPATGPAADAAAAAQCARVQGQFWKYHDLLLTRRDLLDLVHLKQYAGDIGLDRAAFDACLDGGAQQASVQEAMEEAARYGIRSSSQLLVNGRLAPDLPPLIPALEFFSRVVEEELAIQAKASPSRAQ